MVNILYSSNMMRICVSGGGKHHRDREATASEAEEGELGGGAGWSC
jgi:hypothetical protein